MEIWKTLFFERALWLVLINFREQQKKDENNPKLPSSQVSKLVSFRGCFSVHTVFEHAPLTTHVMTVALSFKAIEL